MLCILGGALSETWQSMWGLAQLSAIENNATPMTFGRPWQSVLLFGTSKYLLGIKEPTEHITTAQEYDLSAAYLVIMTLKRASFTKLQFAPQSGNLGRALGLQRVSIEKVYVSSPQLTLPDQQGT